MANLGEPESPVLLVTRPQKALDLDVGDNTESSPALTVNIDDLEVDIYVFVYERYTRAFTMMLDLSVGTVNKHRENMQRKIDCHTAAEIARLAIREALLGA